MTSDDLHPHRSALVATAELKLTEQDWPRLRAVLAEAAEQDGWRLSDCPQSGALGGGLFRESGPYVGYKQWVRATPPEPTATFYIVAQRGSEAWAPAAQTLFRRLAEEWPGALAVTSQGG